MTDNMDHLQDLCADKEEGRDVDASIAEYKKKLEEAKARQGLYVNIDKWLRTKK